MPDYLFTKTIMSEQKINEKEEYDQRLAKLAAFMFLSGVSLVGKQLAPNMLGAVVSIFEIANKTSEFVIGLEYLIKLFLDNKPLDKKLLEDILSDIGIYKESINSWQPFVLTVIKTAPEIINASEIQFPFMSLEEYIEEREKEIDEKANKQIEHFKTMYEKKLKDREEWYKQRTEQLQLEYNQRIDEIYKNYSARLLEISKEDSELIDLYYEKVKAIQNAISERLKGSSPDSPVVEFGLQLIKDMKELHHQFKEKRERREPKL
ncbi:MAG: hypothetical protein WAQ98_32425 [Blastocatellia bacterium]